MADTFNRRMTARGLVSCTFRGALVIAVAGLAVGSGLGLGVLNEKEDADPSGSGTLEMGSQLAVVMLSMSADVLAFDSHLSTLASPYMMGRVPGSEGMERAKDYMEWHFRRAGLEPVFPADGEDFASFRDPFPLGGTTEFESESITIEGERVEFEFVAEDDFVMTGRVGSGTARGEAVFIGYSIEDGPEGYSSFDEDTDLTGQIAVVLRFEPMDEVGRSLWNDGEGWSDEASFDGKLSAAFERGAEGVVVINTPGADDDRTTRLSRFGNSGGDGGPVAMMTPRAGELLAGFSGTGDRLIELRRMADEGTVVLDLGVELELSVQMEREDIVAENVGGMIPGVGDLADEWIVVGAHLDHLGMGYFGSRTGPGELHPGADDNASGAAGLILLADKLMAELEDRDEPRRSILIVGFSGEESGLNGSRHYVRAPIVPAEEHVLMVIWDMIGRIQNERVNMSGAFSGEGLEEWLEPYIAESGLDVQVPARMSGASDHTPFYRAGIPVLFSIIADFHGDYHTPADTVEKINRVGAVKTVRMYKDIIVDAAEREERFAFVEPEAGQRAASGGMGGVKVRFGVMPAYSEDGPGVGIGDVTRGGSAYEAGVESGDRLVRWDGQKLDSIEQWMEMLGRHEPGDTIKIGVLRNDEEVTLDVTLQAR